MKRRFPPGATIIREGEKTTSLYVLLSGKAHAVSRDDQGKEVLHNIFTRGDYFGEMSFIDGQPRSATVITATPARLLVIPSKAFRGMVAANPDLSFSLMNGLIRKIRKATRQIEDIVFIVGQQELHDAHLDTIQRLVIAAEFKDDNTGNHINRVSCYSTLIARKYGMSDEEVKCIRHASPMHDVGKIGIPEYILQKAGQLTPEEFNIIKTHTTIGAKILSNPQSDVLRMGYQIALHHHEHFNGCGYPFGLSREAIPLAARIVGVVDTFDALISRRPYKCPYPTEVAVDLVRKGREKQFDPDIVDLFFENLDKILTIKKANGDSDETASASFTWSERDRNKE